LDPQYGGGALIKIVVLENNAGLIHRFGIVNQTSRLVINLAVQEFFDFLIASIVFYSGVLFGCWLFEQSTPSSKDQDILEVLESSVVIAFPMQELKASVSIMDSRAHSCIRRHNCVTTGRPQAVSSCLRKPSAGATSYRACTSSI
jgi:hypothetical protein